MELRDAVKKKKNQRRPWSDKIKALGLAKAYDTTLEVGLSRAMASSPRSTMN